MVLRYRLTASLITAVLALGSPAHSAEPAPCGGTPLLRVPSNPQRQAREISEQIPDYTVLLTWAPGPAWLIGVYERRDTQHRVNLLPSGLPGNSTSGKTHGPLNLHPMYFTDHANPWVLPVSGTDSKLCIFFDHAQVVGWQGKAHFLNGALVVSWLSNSP